MSPAEFLAVLADLPDGATVPVGWVREQLAAERTPAGRRDEELLTAPEAAGRLGVSVDWLYRRTRSLPFARKLSRKVVRYSVRGLEEYLARRDKSA